MNMKEVLNSRGARNVWDMLDECNGFLESITYCIEEEESDKIDFFPYDSASESNLVKQILKIDSSFPTEAGPHYGGVRVGIVTNKGVGELEIVHDMFDYFSYSMVSRGTQIDYGRLLRSDMISYVSAIAKVLNSSKALKGRKIFKKED
jgi:hypothetical protein